MLNILIMAGGRGERLWPKSRSALPKQFLNFRANKSLLQMTVQRAQKLTDFANIYLAINDSHKAIIHEQIPELPHKNLIIEPEEKNTAPCIGLATLAIESKDNDDVIVVLPCDHMIEDETEFQRLIGLGKNMAIKTDGIVTLGIKPNYPETAYGYIKMGEAIDKDVYRVDSFTEKPELSTAKAYLDMEGYFWNSGIFISKIQSLQQQIKHHLPDLHNGLMQIKAAIGTESFNHVLKTQYERFANISVDYGIMENTSNIYVLPASIGWADLGSWRAVNDLLPIDSEGNATSTRIININSQNNTVISDKLVALLGIDDVIIVETDDSILLARKDKIHDIQEILAEIKRRKWKEYL
jgi:mannose-1-phosphate guanylyltransferase